MNGAQSIPTWCRWWDSTRGLENRPPDCFPRAAALRPVRALTTEKTAVKYLNYSWGVTPVLVDEPEVEPSHLYRSEDFIRHNPEFRKGDCVIITAGQYRSAVSSSPKGTNLIKVFWK